MKKNDILSKLRKNYNCELSINELKKLYGINFTLPKDFNRYRQLRDNYKDFCILFGEEHVAQNENEINENTICYIGDLTVHSKLSTYNLRYIFGSIYYRLNTVYNLENLEIVYKNAYFNYIYEYEGLENLRKVEEILSFEHIQKGDLSTIEYVNQIYFTGLKSAKEITMPHFVVVLWLPLLKSNDGLVLPSRLEKLFISDENILNNLEIPRSINEIYVGDKAIDLNNNEKVLLK